ncbi:MAG: secretin N-terminal domain-containing protein [Planctomycetota bacterium]
MAKRRTTATKLGRPFAFAAALAAGMFSTGAVSAQQPSADVKSLTSLHRLLTEKEHRFSDVQNKVGRYQPSERPQALNSKGAVEKPSARVGEGNAKELIGEFRDVASPDINRARVVMQSTESETQVPRADTTLWSAPRLKSKQSQTTYTATQTSFQAPAPTRDEPTYQLRNVSMQQFEQTLVDTFGSYLRASTSQDGRFVRVEIPGGENVKLTTLVDRQTGRMTFEGQPALVRDWSQLMTTVDQLPKRNVDGSVEAKKMIYREGDSSKVMQQVVHLLSSPQETEVQIPDANLPEGVQDDEDQVIQGIDGLKKPVRLKRTAAGWTLIGDPADVAIVRKELDRLAKISQENQPLPASIDMENVQASTIEERIQEIYDESYEQLFGPVEITSLSNPNRLIVVGQPKAIDAVRKLIEQLDVPSMDEPTDGFKTFVLKHISAADAERRLENFFLQSGLTSGDNNLPSAPVAVISDFRSNQLTVRGSDQLIRTAEAFLKTIDVDKTVDGPVNEVRVVRLRNTLAEEVALVIQDAVSGGQQNANQAFTPDGQQQQQQNQQQVEDNQNQLKSPQLSMMTIGKNGQEIDGGIMFDVRVTADRNSNSLIIAAPQAAMPLVLELVDQLDVIPDAETQIKVFELVYGDAQTVLGMLEALFGGTNQGAANQPGGNLNQLPLQGVSATDGATLVNIRFSYEPRSNAIIASGPAGDLQVIEDLLNRLDARALNHTAPRVYRLSNAPALDVADAINAYLDARNDLIGNDPRNSGVATVNKAVIVQHEVISNSLIVSALPEYRREIEEIIKALDRRPPMVKVKTLIAEVDLDAVEEFGVELGIQDSLLFDRGTSVAASGALTGIGFPFNSAANAGVTPNANAFAQELLAGQAVSQLGVASANTTLGYSGLVLSAGNESISVLMRALKDRQCVRVLSKPHITTLENLQGRVAIGASVPRIAGVVQNINNTTQDVEFQDVGVILEVTPRVSPDGMIVLSVNAEKSSVGPEETGIVVGFASNGDPITSPQILKTTATTTLMARSGQTVVFSGLIDEEKTHIERGAPIISDLPVIGPLFKFESDSSSRRELLIIMTPYLVNDDQDLANLNQDEMDRMHWCLSDVAETYGNTDYGGFIGNEAAVETFYPDVDPAGMMPASEMQQTPVIKDSRLDSPAHPRLSDAYEADASVVETDARAIKSAEKPRRGIFSRRR